MRDIRLIRDQRSNKSKGVGYVEFAEPQGVLNALALNGIAFKGQPLLVQASMAEKNRLAQASKNVAAAASLMGASGSNEPVKLVVSELHPNISEADVSEVFSPFGEVVEITMPADPSTGTSIGIAHLTFRKPEDAKAAAEAINGLELVGKAIVVTLVADAPQAPASAIPNALPNMLPNMMGMGGGPVPGMAGAMAGMAGGMGMGAMGGMAMGGMNMAAMAGMGMGGAAMPGMPPAMPAAMGGAAAGPTTRFVLLKNMFDPNGDDEKNDPHFFDDLCEDVSEEVAKHGAVERSQAVPASAGHLYMQFATVEGAAACVGALHGRWFAGKQVAAATIEEAEWPPKEAKEEPKE